MSTTTTTGTTTYTVYVSDGTEINEYGHAAAVLMTEHVYDDADRWPDLDSAAWVSEVVDVTDEIDEVSERLNYGWEGRLADQVAEAKAEAERMAGQPLDWAYSEQHQGEQAKVWA